MFADDVMKAWLGGDEEAYATLYVVFLPRLATFARALVGEEEGGEDLAQTAFLRLREARDRLRQQGVGNAEALIYSIVRRLAYQHTAYRSRWRRIDHRSGEVADSSMATPTASPDDLLRAAQVGAYITAALDRLPEPQRELVLLRHRVGLSYRMIADVLDTTVPNVKARLNYARKLLRKELIALGITPETI